MADPFIGEIRIVAFIYAPIGWAHCNGQLIPIVQNTALFALLGTYFGGNGTSNFALPDMRGRAPIHAGQGPGLSPRALGNSGGQAAVSLLVSEIPPHQHGPLKVHGTAATTGTPNATRSPAVSANAIYGSPANTVAMGDIVGAGQAHENRQPYLELSFIIALTGIFPPRPS